MAINTTSELEKTIERFKTERSNSLLCRLLNHQDIVSINRNNETLYSTAFLAYYDGIVQKLDSILLHFNIEQRGSTDFKNRLRENWLNESDKKKMRKQVNQVKAALIELIVAHHLDINGEEVLNLSAWDIDCPADIKTQTEQGQIYTEVRFLGQMPDLIDQAEKAVLNGGVAAGFISPMGKIYNYILLRIADAACQFEKKNIPIAQRRMFLISTSTLITGTGTSVFINGLKEAWEWFPGDNWNSLLNELTLTKEQRKYPETPAKFYLSKVNDLIVCPLSDSYELKTLERFRF